MRPLKLATRGSRLALVQAGLVKEALEAAGASVELVEVSTKGDRDQKSPLTQIGGRGLFVKEVETYLLEGRADLAVHSGKDLPYQIAKGLVVAGVPKAAPSEDVLVLGPGKTEAPEDLAVIGTGSPRRELQCRTFYPDAIYKNIRGNVDTRLRKLRDGEYDAILLAAAGLQRLQPDLEGLTVKPFSTEEFVPSACQGLLAVECRETDTKLVALLSSISDPHAAKRFAVERYMFSLLEADCTVPLGVHAEVDLAKDFYTITALYDGKKETRQGTDYKSLCKELQRALLP